MSLRTALVALALSAPLAGCIPGVGVLGNGDVVSETRAVTTFSALDVSNSLEVTIEVDPTAALEVDLTLEAESNLIEFVRTEVTGEVLDATVVEPVTPTETMRITGTVALIDGVRASNSSDVAIDGVDVPTFEVNASNSSRVAVRGGADLLILDVQNSADADLEDLTVIDAEVDLSNSADATICASGVVTGRVTNSASLTVLCGGDASAVEVTNSGSVE